VISNRIESKEELLIEWRKSLDTYSEEMAKTSAEYDKQVALTIMALRNGRTCQIEDDNGEVQKIVDPPVSIIEKVAKGVCWKEKMEMDLANSKYKNAHLKVRSIMAELNSLQTLHKYLA
jgi:hypothetical protein